MVRKIYAGLPVAGYQPQPYAKVALVNRLKAHEERVLRVLDGLEGDPEIDGRWLHAGRTMIEHGFMAVNRAVFRPARVVLEEDADPGREA
jgi:hypothetical protein